MSSEDRNTGNRLIPKEQPPLPEIPWRVRLERAISLGKLLGAGVTFVAAFYAATKPQDETKTKAVYDTVRPAVELLERRNLALEDRVAVLEYRLSELTEGPPASFSDEHPAPPTVPTVSLAPSAAIPHAAPAASVPIPLPSFSTL